MVRDQWPLVKDLVKAAMDLYKEQYMRTYTVKDLLWGYDDPILAIINKVAKLLKINIPIPPKFGLFYGVSFEIQRIHSNLVNTR